MKGHRIEYSRYQVICREGDRDADLYFIESGKLLICTVHGTQVKAIARIEKGEFIGELSFFDGHPRASHVVAMEDSVVIQIKRSDLAEFLPAWYLDVGKNLTKKIRLLDQIITSSNIRRFGSEDQKPLTIDEQRILLEKIAQHKA